MKIDLTHHMHNNYGTRVAFVSQLNFHSRFTSNVVKKHPFYFPCADRPCHPPSRSLPIAQFSSPFPQPDPFSFPLIAFPELSGPDIRPELLGALLWSFGLYFGFSQQIRWAKVVRKFLFNTLSAASIPGATLIADALHSLPFLAAGLVVDASLRYTAEGSAVWAIATGTSVALYAGVYELVRQSNASSQISSEDEVRFRAFQDFASRSLVPTGMCHFVDIRAALRRDPKAGALCSVSDATLRRFLRNTFPKAKRSPNGFYRGLSVRTVKMTTPTRDPDTPPSSSQSPTSTNLKTSSTLFQAKHCVPKLQ